MLRTGGICAAKKIRMCQRGRLIRREGKGKRRGGKIRESREEEEENEVREGGTHSPFSGEGKGLKVSGRLAADGGWGGGRGAGRVTKKSEGRCQGT